MDDKKIPLVLIATAWWPTKTHCFAEYAKGVTRMLGIKEADVQLFIATHLHESKYGSNIGALQQAERWALEYDFTHLLVLDADIVLPAEGLHCMLSADKSVVLAGRGHGEGLGRFNTEAENQGQGWGCTLITTKTLREVPLSTAYAGDYLSPDRMWLKRVEQQGIGIWCLYDVVAELLEPSAVMPMSAFHAD